MRDRSPESQHWTAQRERVVQILKDWKIPYSTGRTSAPDDDSEDSIPFIDQSSAGSAGSWPINAEVRRRWEKHAVAESHRVMEKELARFGVEEPFHWLTLQGMFLRDDCGDADYEHVKAKASEGRDALDRARERRAKGKKPADRDLQIVRSRRWAGMHAAEVDAAIDALTRRLLDTELVAEFPEYPRVKEGEKSTEDRYRELYAVFEEECSALMGKFARHRNKALRRTVDRMNVSKSTVETAVRYFEQGVDAA